MTSTLNPGVNPKPRGCCAVLAAWALRRNVRGEDILPGSGLESVRESQVGKKGAAWSSGPSKTSTATLQQQLRHSVHDDYDDDVRRGRRSPGPGSKARATSRFFTSPYITYITYLKPQGLVSDPMVLSTNQSLSKSDACTWIQFGGCPCSQTYTHPHIPAKSLTDQMQPSNIEGQP